MLRMQQSDGSLLSKVGVTGYEAGSPPSTVTATRYYGAASTSATLTGADVFAHAAIVFKMPGKSDTDAYAATLETAARKAWDWATANPNVLFDNTGFASAAPESETTADAKALSCARAACKLFALTGDTQYRDVFDANYTKAGLFTNSYYLSPYDTDLHSALLYYLRIPGGTASVKAAIANVQPANAGDYTVTASNSSGSMTSARATLTVNAVATPTPSAGGGGGGGAVQAWFVVGLALLWAARHSTYELGRRRC
jgi:endoglucanase